MRGKVKALSLVAKAILVLVCLMMIIPSIFHLYPSLAGAEDSYTVLGGSMQPTLRLGDLAFTEKVDPSDIEVGDIVAVRTDSEIYMHRVVEKKESDEEILFRLKGDANEDSDSSYINGSEIIGKTMFSLPMGYLYTKSGYILTVATPLMLLAVNQAVKIYKIYDKGKRRRRGLKAIILGKGGRRRKKISILDTTSVLLLLILVAGSTQMMTPYLTSGNLSYFSDTETEHGNTITADPWKVKSTITCSVSPSNITLHQNVTISGSIEPARSTEVTVKISVDDGATWSTLTVATSNSDGSYHYQWEPGEAGSYKILASWNGDSSYYGATSEETTFSVNAVNAT